MKKALLLIFFCVIVSSKAFSQAGLLDINFNPETNAQGLIGAIAIQPDGKIVVVGGFTYYNGQPAFGFGRLNTDGSVDATFQPTSVVDNGMSVALQSDGKILVGDAGGGTSGIRRFDANGSVDATFNISTGGANGEVLAIKVQTDGKILIGGRFTFYNGVARNGIPRINADGSLDASFNPGTGINTPGDAVETMELQTDGKIFVAGSFAQYNGTTVNNVARLNTDGTLDTGYLANTGSGIAGFVYTSVLQPDGKIIVAGNFSSFNGFARNSIVRINTNGTIDNTFLTNLSDGFQGGGVFALSLQTDGKIIAAGDFTTFTSGGAPNSRTRIVRLNANGTIDSGSVIGQTFPSIDVLVFATAIQTDGQIWVGGLFTTPRRGLYRLNTSGQLDTTVPYTTGLLNNSVTVNNAVQSIIPLPDGKVILTGSFTNGGGRIVRLNADGTQDFSYSGGANGAIWTSALQSDGKVIIAGDFTFVNSVARNRIARLNADGTLDTTFDPGTGLSSLALSILLQADGKILVCGTFSTFNGSAVNRLVRLNSDGSGDATFNAPTITGSYIRDLQRQTDSKYIIGGLFSNLGGVGRNNIARLNADGTLDATFNPGTGTNDQVNVTRLLSDGKILIGGQFTQFNAVTVNRIARLNTNGSLDVTFNSGSGFDGFSATIEVQSDNKILVGGSFTLFNGNSKRFLARLNADGSFDASFNTGGTGPSNVIYVINSTGDRILIGGNFGIYNGATRVRFARLFNDNFVSAVPAAERTALLALYTNNNGVNWYKQKNWNTSAPVESWQGVKVTAGRVTNLDLSFGNLTGVIPNQVGDLVKLKTIYLNNNALTAQDPLLVPKLPLLTDLEEIDYSSNALTGSIVPQIGSLTALKRLILYNNRISGSLPAEIGNLTNLVTLDITNNILSGSIPAFTGSMPSLQFLYLSSNGFSGSVPTQIGQFAQLKELNLSGNQLKNIPDNLFTNLTGLTWLGLNTNLFSGNVPSSIAGLTALTTLRISDNYFNGIPSLAELTNLSAANFTAALNLFDFADIQSAPVALQPNFSSQRTLDVGNIIKGVGEVANFNGPPEAGFGTSLTYQWSKTGTASANNIIGATAINYSIPSAQLSDMNVYFLKVSSTATPGITLNYSYNLSIKNDQQFTWETNAGLIPGQNVSYSGSWGDMDNDGDDDLFISRWSTQPNALYINNGNGTFTASNATFLNEVNPARWSSWVDFNNDGKLDVAIAGTSGLRGSLGTAVYINQGGGNFTRQSLDGFNEHQNLNFADYDNDGKMDYLLIGGSPSKIVSGATGTSFALSFFTGGIGVPYFIDIDNDNDLDFFCSTSNPLPAARLFINDGVGNLVENTTNLIVTDASSTTSLNRGASWFDIDNDGDVDLVSLNQTTAANSRVYINDGVGNFTSKTTVEVFGEDIASRLSTHGDFDADGDQDFMVASTLVSTVPTQPVIYSNNGNGTFTRVPQTTQTFQTISGFEGASLSDYTNDGFLDVFVGNFNGGNAQDLRGEFLYKNKGNTNNWLKLKLVGRASTRTPLGAKIKTFTNGNQQLRTMSSFEGFVSANSTVVHFGLGANTKADSIQVFWPSGLKQTIKNVNAKQFLTLNEEIPLDKDSVVLRQFYTATGGTGWTNKTNWLSGPVKTWFGVATDRFKVTKLNLPGNNLTGSLPPAIGNLTAPKFIDLGGNQLTGTVPVEVFKLTTLDTLGLARNKFSGTLPTQVGNITGLRALWLDENRFSGVLPNQVSTLTQLRALFVQKNQFTGLPNLTSLANLSGVDVSQNRLNFTSLEPNAAIAGIVYAPQDSLETNLSILKQLNENHTFTSAAGGTATSHQWRKNGTNVSGQTNATLTINNIPLSEDGNVYSYTATNTIVTGLTLISRPKVLKVSSLKRDSTALRAFYNATGGSNWTNKTNWTTTRLSTGNWFGVTITNNRVVGLSLPNNNLIGRVPADLADVKNLTTLNLASNKLVGLPDLKPLSSVTALNVSANRLDFASLLPNATIAGINYANQADLGTPVTELLDVGQNYTVKVSTKGAGNTIQWKRNGTVVPNATDSSYQINSISRANQGTYVAEVRNAGVPGLTLKTANQNIYATATLSGKMTLDGSAPVSKGNIFLLKVTAKGGYDTTATKAVNTNGTFVFAKTILDDYILQGKPDPTASPDRLLIYYKDKLFWEEADTLKVQNSRTGLDLTLQKKPEPPTGKGVVTGILEEDKPGGRVDETLARGRVSGATVSVRRVQSAGRTQNETLTLVATAVTDDQGNFTLPNLPPAKYRLNIQYPGYPMDPNSFINFDIGTQPSSTTVNVNAVVSAQSNKIVVSLVRITEIYDELKLSPYPNPASEKLFVEFDRSVMNAQGVLFTDLTGRPMKVETTTTEKGFEVKVGTIPPGLYLLSLVDENNFKLVTSKVAIK